MRAILTLSLPAEMLESLKQKARRAGTSVSGYVRRIVAHEENIISEDELFMACKEAEHEYRKGKTRVLRDPSELARNL